MSGFRWLRPISDRVSVSTRERNNLRARIIDVLDRQRAHPGVDNGLLASDILHEVLDVAVDT